MSAEAKPAEWMLECAREIWRSGDIPRIKIAAIIARHAPTPAPSLEREAVEALREIVPYLEREIASNQAALHGADEHSQFYGEDIITPPLLSKARAVLAKAQT